MLARRIPAFMLAPGTARRVPQSMRPQLPLRKAGRKVEVATPGQVRRIRYLLEETTVSLTNIARSVVLSLPHVQKIIKEHTDWRQRTRITGAEGRSAVFAILDQAARKGIACPSNSEMANQLAVSEMHVELWVKGLIGEGLIQSARKNYRSEGKAYTSRHRVITIVASGRKTKKSTASEAWFRKRPEPGLLQKAMNFVRSRGPIVYSAKIKYPGRDGIMVDYRHHSEEAFMMLASTMGFVENTKTGFV